MNAATVVRIIRDGSATWRKKLGTNNNEQIASAKIAGGSKGYSPMPMGQQSLFTCDKPPPFGDAVRQHEQSKASAGLNSAKCRYALA